MSRNSNRSPFRWRSPRGAAFLYGAAHALDLGGNLARNRGRFADGLQGDSDARKRDWEITLTGGWLPPLNASSFEEDGESWRR